jgi:hypothetical protein
MPAEGIGRLPADVDHNQTLAPEVLVERSRVN